jgi:hypothetical protein
MTWTQVAKRERMGMSHPGLFPPVPGPLAVGVEDLVPHPAACQQGQGVWPLLCIQEEPSWYLQRRKRRLV